jgi:hypothetical protein
VVAEVAAVALRAVEEPAEVAVAEVAARVQVVAPAPEEAATPAAVLAVPRAAEGVAAVVEEQVEA